MAEAAKHCLYTFPRPIYCFWLLFLPFGLPLNLGQALILPGSGQWAGKITPTAPEGCSGPSPAGNPPKGPQPGKLVS